VPLSLVTGPANAAKARRVLDAFRAAVERAAAGAAPEPILVVPTAADVELYRRELARGRTVFGARVVRFDGLIAEIADRAGVRSRVVGEVAREAIARAAVAATRLDALAPSSATPGFPAALVRLAAEMEEQRIEPPRLAEALRAWGAGDARRRRYGGEVGTLYAAYRERLERAGLTDPQLHAVRALDELRLAPGRWGATPVFLYGFDDLTPIERDTVETLSGVVGAPVLVSLAYEPGRVAFDGRATAFQDLLAIGGEAEILEAEAEHYAPAARGALHHLERSLFEPHVARRPAGDAVQLLEGGGERAELELVAGRVRRLLDDPELSLRPEEVAIVLRSPDRRAAALEEVLGAYGVPFAFQRRVAAGRTALGRGLVCLGRSALAGATADDLLVWLRTPGVLRRPELADRLEAVVRRRGIATAAAARERFEQDGFPLNALDRVAAAAARGPAALLERLGHEAALLFAAPFRRQAPVLGAAEATDARVLAAVRRALDELHELAVTEGAPTAVLSPQEIIATVEALPVMIGERPRPGLVTVCDPLALRARRVRVLALCDLQEGSFPRADAGDAEPFFSDDERFALSQALGGVRLRRGDDALAAERYLFYATVSRPTERLLLSWHAADDDAGPAVASFFIADVCDVFDDELLARRGRRALGEVGWGDGPAPTPREAARAGVAAADRLAPPGLEPLRDPAVLGALADRPAFSPSALEVWASCPARWFVERLLRPNRFGPDPEAMVRGSLAHRVLEDVLRDLAGPLHAGSLPRARELLAEALERHAADHPISVDARRLRAQARRLTAHLERYLDHAAQAGSPLVADRFEVAFGAPEDPLGPLELAGGELRVLGRIDRVDVGPGGEALVVDYKSGKALMPGAKWREDRQFQAVLYLLALRHVLGLEPVGAVYQPLGAEDLRARGAVDTTAQTGTTVHASDHFAREDFEALVEEVVAAALEAVQELRAGQLQRRPTTCGYKGTCAHPGFCRWEA
jgi:ATP-dependent helicase/DNAse subunit B